MAKRYTQSFDGYFRGILQRKNPRQVDLGFVDEALNVTFRGGAIQGRPGIRPFHGARFAGPVRGMGWHVKTDGTRELLVAAGPYLQRCTFGGDPISIPLSSLPTYDQLRLAQQHVYFLSMSGGTNTTFIYDGVNPNVKWDGTVLSKMGLPNGPTPPVPSDGSGLITKGLRKYVMTLNSPYHEGDVSVVKREVNLTTNEHALTFTSPAQTADAIGSAGSIATAAAANQYDDPQVTKWRLYRTDAAGSVLKFVGEASIGIDIVDNLSDELLFGSDLVEQLRNGPPLAPIVAMVEHRGQMIAVMSDDRSLLRFSNFDPDYMVPEGWPANQVQPVTHSDGDEISAMRSFSEWCVVFKQNSTHAIVGTNFADYKIVPVIAGGTRAGVGCAFPGSVLQVDNAVFFAARDGIYRIDRSGDLTALRISKEIDDLYSAVNFSLGSACFYDRKRRLFVFLSHG